MLRPLPLACAVLIAGSCNNSSNHDALLARVGDKTLTWQQLQSVIPDNSSAEDSTALAEGYLNNWITEQLVLAEAQKNLDAQKLNFEDLIESYRNSLITYAFEEQLINQKLDTVVSESEMAAYYEQNKANFELKDYILKVKFCALAADHKQLKALKKLFYSTNPEDIVKWQQLCVDTDAAHYFSEDTWLTFDELKKQIPIKATDPEDFLRRNKSQEFEHEGNTYMLLITEYKLSGSVSPLEFEKQKIRQLIVNKRKIDFLAQLRNDLYREGLEKKMIEIYK